ncbi:hypothetical protein C8J57DRAFT_1469958 [Mycena rebaudengoi]|nr:hypothetical protein C8J57DRAFT_1469958 [Mycena rebaudengoi]
MSWSGKLPVELERLVFELAAETRPTIPHLILVAQRVRAWLEPLLYRVLQLSSPYLAARVMKSVKTKPAPFLASTVRHVLVNARTYSLDLEMFESFLKSCSGITSLSIEGDIIGANLLPVLGNMRVQRLSVNMEQLFRDKVERPIFGDEQIFGHDDDNEDDDHNKEDWAVDLQHPLFAAASHLDIFDYFDIEKEEPEAMRWLKHLSALPALTHLAFSSPPNPQVMYSVLDSCPRIDVLLIMFPVIRKNTAKEYLKHIADDFCDSRFVAAIYKDYYSDWELGARGGKDIWARAEEFIARKKRGEIEGPFDLLSALAFLFAELVTAVGDYFLDDSPVIKPSD